MQLKEIISARCLYYQCLGEFFTFSFSSQSLEKLKAYLTLMKECLFDEDLTQSFNTLFEYLSEDLSTRSLKEEYEVLFLSLKNSIPTTFSYIEEGFENSRALLCVRQILFESGVRRNETLFKESEDSVGFCFLLMSEFLRMNKLELAKELFENVINKGIDEFLTLVLTHKASKLYKEISSIAVKFIEFERFCFGVDKPLQMNTKKVQNDLARSELLRRQTNKQRREREKSQRLS